MLRGPGEFDPSARGVASAAVSQAWPSPSTLTGLLISGLLQQLPPRASDWRGYVEKVLGLLDHLGVEWVRGPYLVVEGRCYFPLRLGERLLAVGRERLRDVAEALRPGRRGAPELLRGLAEERVMPRVLERVGVALRAREGSKTVREGYLFSAAYAALPKGGCVAVEVESRASLASLHGAAMPLGGEGRIARIEVEEARPIIGGLEGFEGGYALLLSPLILPEGAGAVREGGRVRVEVGGRPVLELAWGSVGVRGLGFSIAEGRRKPMYPAVHEGSIVRIEGGCRDLGRLGLYACMRGAGDDELLEFLGRTGFGSFAPLPAAEP